jgi:hypothetical protein
LPSQINKLQPDRTIHLQGFDAFGAAAAMHSASPTGFSVSGVFRDAADFAVLMLWDADCFFEHPRLKYLPDFDFSGMVLQFDVSYAKLQPLDSQKFPTIDWPYLDVVRSTDGTTAQINLFNNATFVSGSYSAASGVFQIVSPGAAAFDRLTLWFQNIAFDFVASGGETAADVAAALAAQINTFDWTGGGGINALSAVALGAQLTITNARYGHVNTSGKAITLAAGQNFAGLAAGDPIVIGGVATSVTAIGSAAIQVANDFGVQASLPYLAPRGGTDGNMVTLYALAKNTNLTTSQSLVQLAGGSSAATWRITLDFTALGIDKLRQAWLTFAPRLAFAAAYVAEEWDAVFTNWSVTDSNGKRPLKVAGPGSVRIEETDSWVTLTGASWAAPPGEGGFYSQGFAQRAGTLGDSVTIRYTCQFVHDLYVGTALYSDRGMWAATLDGATANLVDTYLATTSEIPSRRLLQAAVPAGTHTVTLTVAAANAASTGNFCYFDFLEAAVVADVPDPLPLLPDSSPAIDYDTNHGFQLSPARLMNIFDNLGFSGPIDEYLGVFWWNQRKAVGAVFPVAVVTLLGNFVAGDQIFIEVGTAFVGKTVLLATESNAVIAAHLAYFINETFSGVWATWAEQGDGVATLTVTARSAGAAAYNFPFAAIAVTVVGSDGVLTFVGTLEGGILPEWVIDDTVSPPLNYAARQWHADLFAQVAARGWSITSAVSMELVNPPDDPDGGHVWTARFRDGVPVLTATGFGVLNSSQCVPNAPYFLAYQQAVFLNLAQLQLAAGLTPELQFGEYLWWFFTDYDQATNLNGGMAYYDLATAAAALTTLGRALGTFLTPNDDPAAVNGGADTDFLADTLRDHVAAIGAAVRAAYPTALLELLWPFDVNYPVPIGREKLGGRLNYRVNLPEEWRTKAGSGLDRFKMEALDFGSGTRSLDLALLAIRLPGLMGWPLGSIRYLFPLFNGGCPFLYEQQLAREQKIPALTPFAMDHVCLFAWDLRAPLQPAAQLL